MSVIRPSDIYEISSINEFDENFEAYGWSLKNFDPNIIFSLAGGDDVCLLLVDKNFWHVATCQRHIRSMCLACPTKIVIVDIEVVNQNYNIISLFSSIVFHYSVAVFVKLSDHVIYELSFFDVPKILCIQDEYRLIVDVLRFVESVRITAIFTLQPDAVARAIYRSEYCRKFVLIKRVGADYIWGMVPQPPRDWASRPLDICYRARALPRSFGREAVLKGQIGLTASVIANDLQFRTDISVDEEDRLYGSAWTDLLSSSKSALGTSSDVSVADFDGRIYAQQSADLQKGALGEFPANDLLIKFTALSPRLIEYAQCGCLPILVKADFDGLLEANRDYLAIDRSGEGLDGLTALIASPERALEMIARFQAKVWSYPLFQIEDLAAKFGEALFTAAAPKGAQWHLEKRTRPVSIQTPQFVPPPVMTTQQLSPPPGRKQALEILVGRRITRFVEIIWTFYRRLLRR